MIEELGKSGIKILLYLYEEGASSITRTLRGANIGHTTLYSALIVLKEFKLITEERQGWTRILRLTPLGMKIAKKLSEADDILSNRDD